MRKILLESLGASYGEFVINNPDFGELVRKRGWYNGKPSHIFTSKKSMNYKDTNTNAPTHAHTQNIEN